MVHWICFFFRFMRCSPSTNFQRRCLVNSGPFLKIATTPYCSTVVTGSYRTKGTAICLKEPSIIRQSISTCAWDRLLRKKISHRFLTPPLTFKIACSAGIFRYLAYLIGKSAGSSVINPISVKGDDARRGGCLFNSNPFWVLEYSNLSQFFHSDGAHNFFGYSDPQVDELLSQLDGMANPTVRGKIGRQVLSLVQEDFAVILLAPCFQYTLSPLEIQFDDNLTDTIDLIQNMSQLTVERHRTG